MVECPARAIWDMGQGPGACAVDLAPRAKLCAWPEFSRSERQRNHPTPPTAKYNDG